MVVDVPYQIRPSHLSHFIIQEIHLLVFLCVSFDNQNLLQGSLNVAKRWAYWSHSASLSCTTSEGWGKITWDSHSHWPSPNVLGWMITEFSHGVCSEWRFGTRTVSLQYQGSLKFAGQRPYKMALVRAVGLPRGSGLWGGERLGAGRASGRYFFEH